MMREVIVTEASVIAGTRYVSFWEQIESYICQHSDAQFSHSICPECRDGVLRDELARWRERR